MINVICNQSGMNFIADNAFHIEESITYKKLNVHGIRSVEFIRVKNNNLLFIEAKETFPNPGSPSADNLVKFNLEVDEICEKIIHSLNLFLSMLAGVTAKEFPDSFILPAETSLVFILVIKNHKLEWCRKVKSRLIETLPSYIQKIWKPKIFVINHITAVKRNLAINETA